MKTRQFAIVALIAALAVPVAVVEGNSGGSCKVQGANGSLEVSAEKMELLRQNNWKATDETGRLVCE